MSTTVTLYGNVGVLTVKDELTGENVEVFTDHAKKFVEEGRFDAVVDCSGVEAVDSTGLEALLSFQNQCEEQLGCVKLCCLSPTCSKILEITRMVRRFETYPDLDSAVRSFA